MVAVGKSALQRKCTRRRLRGRSDWNRNGTVKKRLGSAKFPSEIVDAVLVVTDNRSEWNLSSPNGSAMSQTAKNGDGVELLVWNTRLVYLPRTAIPELHLLATAQ